MNRGNAVNALLFQAAWFACVLGGARDVSLWGLIAVVGLAGYSLTAGTVRRDLVLASLAAVVGFLLETAWIRTGVLVYAGAVAAPVWIVLLWVGVGLTVNHSLAFLQRRPWLGGTLAGATAPLSYLAGERLGAVTVPEPWLLAAVSAAWFVLFTLGFSLARAGDVFDRGGPAADIIDGKRSVT
jgi:hypothetical protein